MCFLQEHGSSTSTAAAQWGWDRAVHCQAPPSTSAGAVQAYTRKTCSPNSTRGTEEGLSTQEKGKDMPKNLPELCSPPSDLPAVAKLGPPQAQTWPPNIIPVLENSSIFLALSCPSHPSPISKSCLISSQSLHQFSYPCWLSDLAAPIPPAPPSSPSFPPQTLPSSSSPLTVQLFSLLCIPATPRSSWMGSWATCSLQPRKCPCHW